MRRISRFLLAFLLTLLPTLLFTVPHAAAATMNVTPNAGVIANDGQCSLSEAVIAANTNAVVFVGAGECPAGNPAPTVDEIIVPPGVYAVTNSTANPESGLIITESAITIRSQVYTGVSPNDPANAWNANPARTAANEAILVPAINDPDSTNLITLRVNAPTAPAQRIIIDGLVLDGDNPALTGGAAVIINGVDVNGGQGIVTYDAVNPNGFPVNQVTIQNTIVRNINWWGIGIYNTTVAGAINHDILITNNRFDNLSGRTPSADARIAVFIGNSNTYATVTNNTFTRVFVGVQTGNNHLANPVASPAPAISNNLMQIERRGIFHNLHYQQATAYTIANNVIQSIPVTPTPAFTDGIFVSSIQSTVDANLSNNNITGFGAGYVFWNIPTTATISVEGGTLTNNQRGVWFQDYNHPANIFPGFGAGSAGTNTVELNNLNITGSTIAGILVDDDPLATNVDLVLRVNNSTVTGTSTANGIWMRDLDNGSVNNPLLNVVSSVLQNGNTGLNIEGNFAAASSVTRSCIFDNVTGATAPLRSIFNATNNWWGATTGPGGSGPGTGNPVNASINFNPFIDTPTLVAGTPAITCGLIPPTPTPTPTTPATTSSSTSSSVAAAPNTFSDSQFIVKSVDKSIVAVGDQVTFTINFGNPKGNTLNNVVIADTFDSRFSNIQVVSSSLGNAVVNGNTVSVQGFSLLPGQRAVLVVTAVVSTRARAGDVISNVATLESPDASIHTSNTVTVTILPGLLPATGETPVWRMFLIGLLGLLGVGFGLRWLKN